LPAVRVCRRKKIFSGRAAPRLGAQIKGGREKQLLFRETGEKRMEGGNYWRGTGGNFLRRGGTTQLQQFWREGNRAGGNLCNRVSGGTIEKCGPEGLPHGRLVGTTRGPAAVAGPCRDKRCEWCGCVGFCFVDGTPGKGGHASKKKKRALYPRAIGTTLSWLGSFPLTGKNSGGTLTPF